MKSIYSIAELNIDNKLNELNSRNKLPKGVYLVAPIQDNYINIWDARVEQTEHSTHQHYKLVKILFRIDKNENMDI